MCVNSAPEIDAPDSGARRIPGMRASLLVACMSRQSLHLGVASP